MATPTTREELKQYCLRRLGSDVTEINISEGQMDDRIDDALKFYRDFHYDGSERTFLKHQLTQTDIDNKYLPMDQTVLGVIRIFPIGYGLNTNNIFNLRYQITLNDIHNWQSAQMQEYTERMKNIALMEEIFVGQQPIRFNRHTDRLYIDMDWDRVQVGEFIVIEAYQQLDPNTYTQVWGDWWLGKYTTQLFKLQWGENLSKFGNMQLPGGVILNGERIYQEAQTEVEKLETEVKDNWSIPAFDMIG